jgi:DNA mismatch repair protein MutS
LSLRYDGQTLIYDRKLKPGPGDSIYGLEVANSLNLDYNFMQKAYTIRKEIEGDIKKSRYNSKVYLNACFICGNKKNILTHHIQEQHKSDDKGFIGHMHKNIPGNLICMCQDCHEFLHSKGLHITSTETSKGNMLSFETLKE